MKLINISKDKAFVQDNVKIIDTLLKNHEDYNNSSRIRIKARSAKSNPFRSS